MSIEEKSIDSADLYGNEEIEDLDEINEVLPANFLITAYGADYPVDGLVKRISNGDIVIPMFSSEAQEGQSTVGFQREFVWRKPQADRFVESLLLGLPVPGIFLVKEGNGKHLVLDGQQRLRTLQNFFDGVFQGKAFVLENVQSQWSGKTYKTLNAEDRRRLDDSIIHATIVRQDEPTDDQGSIYLIFERLNSGGTFLQPQEIRVALYHGEFASFLSQLNNDPNWRQLYGKKNARLKDIELILRFFALLFYNHNYKRPMKEFLNKYMSANRHMEKQSADVLRPIFQKTVLMIEEAIGTRAFRPKSTVNAAVLDAVMVGVAARLAGGPIADIDQLRAAYEKLIGLSEFDDATTRSTADEENVRMRLSLSREIFSTVR